MVSFLEVTGFDCGGKEVLQSIKFAMTMIKVICTVIPILVILLIIIDFVKNIKAGTLDEMKSTFNLTIKKLLMCVLVYFVPTVVQVAMSVVNDLGVDYSSCIKIAMNDDLSIYEVIYPDVEFDEVLSVGNNISAVVISASNGGGGSYIGASLNVPFSDAVIENLAAFIGSESGAYPEGFEGQLMTGAVFINNMFFPWPRKTPISSLDQLNLNTMCATFKYESLYKASYCNYSFAGLEKNGIKFNDTQKKQLITVASIILSKNFTIPKGVIGQGNLSNWNSAGGRWGRTTTHSGCVVNEYADTGCAQVFAYSTAYGLGDTDVYGNKVSTDFSSYAKKADRLYQTFVK